MHALGAVVAIRLTGLEDADAEAVRRVWADAVADEGRTDAVATVSPRAGDDRDAMLVDLSQRVTRAAIEAVRGKAWILHAAGLAASNGRVIVFVGPSGSGKTCVVSAVGAALGLGYVSDDAVAIDGSGAVLPYRKPLTILADEAIPRQSAPRERGIGALPDAPLQLAAIVLLDRRDDAGDLPLVTPVDFGDALSELVAQSSHLADMAAPLQTMAALAASVGTVHRLTYRNADRLGPAVAALLAETPAAVDPTACAASAAVLRPAPSEEGVPVYTRALTLDALSLADPDRLALLHVDQYGQGTVRMLAGIAPAIWRAADAATLDDLVAAVVAEHGTPGERDAAASVVSVVDTLRREGVLEERPRWAIRESAVWTDLHDRVVVLVPRGGGVVPRALEGSAAAVWLSLVDGAGSVRDIAEPLAARLDADPAAVGAEVSALLENLEDAGVVARLS